MINLTLKCLSLFQNYASSYRIGILSNEALQPDRQSENWLEHDIVKATNSKMNLWRVNTVVWLHVLNASEAAATA
jgi:hypothetical protein